MQDILELPIVFYRRAPDGPIFVKTRDLMPTRRVMERQRNDEWRDRLEWLEGVLSESRN